MQVDKLYLFIIIFSKLFVLFRDSLGNIKKMVNSTKFIEETTKTTTINMDLITIIIVLSIFLVLTVTFSIFITTKYVNIKCYGFVNSVVRITNITRYV